MNDRLIANKQILKLLSEIIDMHPEWRFHQVLQNIDINMRNFNAFSLKDLFYEESTETLDRMEKNVYVAIVNKNLK